MIFYKCQCKYCIRKNNLGSSDVYLTGLEGFPQLCILQIPTIFTSHIILPKEYLTKSQPNPFHLITCRLNETKGDIQTVSPKSTSQWFRLYIHTRI